MKESVSSEFECYSQFVAEPGKKQQQKTAATRKALLKAAKAVFIRDGFAASRIEDIAAEAGRSRGAFYANFKCKEDVFFALVEEELSEKERRGVEIISKGRTLAERQELGKKFFIDSVLSDPSSILLRLEFKLYAIRRPQIHKRLAEAERKLKQRLNFEALGRLLSPEEGTHTPVPDEQMRTGLEALVDGIGLALSFDPERISEGFASKCLGLWFEILLQNIGCTDCPARSKQLGASSKGLQLL